MSETYFIGDLHYGHKRITDFKNPLEPENKYRTGDNCIENMHQIVTNWNSRVTKRDRVYVLGDAAFTQEGFEALKELKGTKILVRGNHDNAFTTQQWLEVFESVEGIVRYKEFWLTHAPIHPCELRGKKNIHGHVHYNSVKNAYLNTYDPNYINVSCEAIGETPVSLQEIRSGAYDLMRKC